MTTALGFLGTGFIARFHVMMLSLSDEPSEIVSAYDTDPERARAFVEDHGGVVAADEDEVVARSDAVFVCTWTAEHARLVSKVAAAGKPVFCEKPLAFDADRAAAMAADVDAAGVVNQVGLVLRYSPSFQLVRSLVHDPQAGQVMSVVFRDDQYIPNQGQYESVWRIDPSLAGAGTMLEHSIHDLDIIEHVIGPISSLSARTENRHGHAGIEDNAAAVLTFRDGGLGVLTSVWHDILERPSGRNVEVFCERLRVELENDLFGPVRWQYTGSDEQVLQDEALMTELQNRGIEPDNPASAFLRAVRTGGAASPTFDDAVRAHRLVDAVYQSASAGGAPVEVAR